jgi:cation:H+ antiporter
LVDAACCIAQRLGVSELMVGLTIVGFGTSAPEMAASLSAGLQGNGDITIANVVGSNIFNLCFILGGVAFMVEGGIRADREVIVRDGPVLLVGTLLLLAFVGGVGWSASGPGYVFDHSLERMEGAILLALLALYLLGLFFWAKRGNFRLDIPEAAGARFYKSAEIVEHGLSTNCLVKTRGAESLFTNIFALLLGLLFVIGGCHVLVGRANEVQGAVHGFGALWFAKALGVPDYIIGVTIVAAGTSAPEFVVSLVAALRRSFSVSIGNILGSEIFNIFGVVGLAGMILQQPVAPAVSISPTAVPSLLSLCGLALVTVFFLWTGRRVSRGEGLVLVLIGIGRWYLDFTLQT